MPNGFFLFLAHHEELDYDYGYNQRDDDDNDYEFEKKYKMSIRNLIRDIKEIIMGSSDGPRAEIEFLFLLYHQNWLHSHILQPHIPFCLEC